MWLIKRGRIGTWVIDKDSEGPRWGGFSREWESVSFAVGQAAMLNAVGRVRPKADSQPLKTDKLMKIIEEIHSAWGWAGLIPDEIVGQNDFGNLLVRDTGGISGASVQKNLSVKLSQPAKLNLMHYQRTKNFFTIGT